MSNDEQMKDSIEDVVSGGCNEGSVKQFGLEKTLSRTLSPRKPKSAAKPPKFRSLEKCASAKAQTSYDAEIAKKVEQAAAAAPKSGLKKLERLGKFRLRSGKLDFDISTIRV